MKTLTTIVYTTGSEKALARELEPIRAMINGRIQNGRLDIITVKRIKERDITPVVTPSTKRIDWGWFKRELTNRESAKGYDIVAFHFTQSQKRKWKILKKLNGSYQNDADHALEFWFAADRGKKAPGYKNTTEIFRLFCHEILHGFFRKTGINSDFVHTLDYDQKNVASGFYLVNLDKYERS